MPPPELHMDGSAFDAFSRSLAHGPSRRTLTRVLGGLGAHRVDAPARPTGDRGQAPQAQEEASPRSESRTTAPTGSLSWPEAMSGRVHPHQPVLQERRVPGRVVSLLRWRL